MFQQQAMSGTLLEMTGGSVYFYVNLKTHNKFSEFCPAARKICLKALVKVLGVIYTKLTIDRAEDTQPHAHIHN